MGDPKRQRKKYEAPRFPWSKTELSEELRLLGEYGLRNKRELWRHHYMISKYRNLARQLLAQPEDERVILEKQLINKLAFIRVIPENADLDAVLDLSVEQILARRLQTLVFKNGLAKTTYQARQLIVHGHISIKERKVTVPSYLVPGNEEGNIQYTSSSPFASSGLIQVEATGEE
jgi:small subunit ribosomal protein S4